MQSKLFIAFISFMVSTAIFADSENNKAEKYLQMLQQQQFSELKKIAHATWTVPDADDWQTIASVIAEHATFGRTLLNIFTSDSSVEGTNLYAELLVRCARGAEIPSWEREKRKLDELSIDEIGERALKLIQHPDPFICALADWAIAIRVGMENGGRTKVWPAGKGPDWYQQWQQALTPDFMLQADYARQCIALDQHRFCQALLQSAQTIQSRIQNL